MKKGWMAGLMVTLLFFGLAGMQPVVSWAAHEHGGKAIGGTGGGHEHGGKAIGGTGAGHEPGGKAIEGSHLPAGSDTVSGVATENDIKEAAKLLQNERPDLAKKLLKLADLL